FLPCPTRRQSTSCRSTCFSLRTNAPSSAIYTLSLHDALPILAAAAEQRHALLRALGPEADVRVDVSCTPVEHGDIVVLHGRAAEDRKSTRLNSSHVAISYAVLCLKKKNNVGPDPLQEDDHSKN